MEPSKSNITSAEKDLLSLTNIVEKQLEYLGSNEDHHESDTSP